MNAKTPRRQGRPEATDSVLPNRIAVLLDLPWRLGVLAFIFFFVLGDGQGLNSLSDDSLRIELANDGLSTLLNRAFDDDNVTPDRQAPERAVVALHELADPKLPAAQRSSRLRAVVAGIEPALPEIHDPQVLLSAAALIVKEGVEQDVNVLEYFGDDGAGPARQRLRPVVKTAIDTYDRAIALLDQRQQALQEKITSANDPAAAQWQNVYKDLQTASYTRWMLSYSEAISLDPSDKNRATTAEDAIKNLVQWDNADSGVQATVRLQEGKLLMIEGRTAKAKADFLSVFLGSENPNTVNPPADRFTQFNARYFYAVSDVIAGDAELAEGNAKTADDFRRAALPGVAGDEYAMDMLHYRIAVLRGDNQAAVKILNDLSDKAPGLRNVIAGHLLDRLPPHPDVSTLSPLMLSALVEKAWSASTQPNADPAILNDGLAAAQRYVELANNVDPQTTQQGAIEAAKARGVLLRALGRNSEAASAFLDYAEKYKDNLDAQTDDALNAAIAIVADLSRNQANDPHQTDLSALEDRILPLAVDSYRRYDLAYEYARHLQRSGRPARAADTFDLVPANDPNKSNAIFFRMVALNQRLDADPHDLENAVGKADVPAIVAQIQHLADEFRRIAQRKESESKTPAEALQFKSMLARTTLLAADVAGRQGRDPSRTLKLLTGFETTLNGLPDAQPLLAEALNLRVAAFMAAGDVNHAASTLTEYLNTAGGNEGLQTVYNLLTKLNQQLDHAQAIGDEQTVRQLANDRAGLTPFLVQWAKSNPNPDINKFTYRYEVFDAATQKQAAELEADPTVRKSKLEAALAKYRQLQSPDNVKLYQASLPADAGDDVRNYLDPQVTLGMADVAFALGDWKTAHDSIGELLADSKLGDGTMTVKNAAGQEEEADNDQFWEAQYQFIYATLQLSKDPSTGVEASTPREILDRLTALWQDHVGGTTWHARFVELAAEMK